MDALNSRHYLVDQTCLCIRDIALASERGTWEARLVRYKRLKNWHR